jgi:hypothetical protein
MTDMNVLASYWYFRDADLDAIFGSNGTDGCPTSVMSDSGAFSAWTQGASIDVDDYAAWVLANRRWLDVIVTLDVIGDPVATWDNTQRMIEHGIDDVIPVWHMGEPFDALARYIEAGFTHIGIGGMVGRPPSSLHTWCAQAFRMAEGTDALFHSFGRTTKAMVHDFPWYTLDSTTWLNGCKYGELTLFDDARGWFVRLQAAKRHTAARYATTIRLHHEDPAEWLDSRASSPQSAGTVDRARASELYNRQRRMSVQAWLRMESWLQQRRAVGGDGPKVYLGIGPGDWQRYFVGQPEVIERDHRFELRLH